MERKGHVKEVEFKLYAGGSELNLDYTQVLDVSRDLS